MIQLARRTNSRGVLAFLLALASAPAVAARPEPVPPGPTLAYADIIDLADRSPSVIRANVRKAIVVDAERVSGLQPGWARIYVEARVTTLLSGPPLVGGDIRYLADVRLDPRGKVPKFSRREVLLFARTVTGRQGELQLVAPDAQVPWDPVLEGRVRAVLSELLAPDAPGRIGKVREAIHVPGTLAGSGETQMFLATADGEPASITVVHTADQPPRWSVSFSEVMDASGEPPPPETLAWYRLACFLPGALDPAANVSATDEDRARADADYAFVRQSLGTCPRERR